MNVLNTRIFLRRDTSQNWSDVNPILGSGEMGWDETNKILKIGDNVTPWNALSSFTGNSASSGGGGYSSSWGDILTDWNSVVSTTIGGTGRVFSDASSFIRPMVSLDSNRYLGIDGNIHYFNGSSSESVSGWNFTTPSSACISPDGIVWVAGVNGTLDFFDIITKTVYPVNYQGIPIKAKSVVASEKYVLVESVTSANGLSFWGGSYPATYQAIYLYARASNVWLELLPSTHYHKVDNGAVNSTPPIVITQDGNVLLLSQGDSRNGVKDRIINLTTGNMSEYSKPSASNVAGAIFRLGPTKSGINVLGTIPDYLRFVDSQAPVVISTPTNPTFSNGQVGYNGVPLPNGSILSGKFIFSGGVTPSITESTTLLNGSTLSNVFNSQFYFPDGKIYCEFTNGKKFLNMNFSELVPSSVLLSPWFNRFR